jgi:hypothetical protein
MGGYIVVLYFVYWAAITIAGYLILQKQFSEKKE